MMMETTRMDRIKTDNPRNAKKFTIIYEIMVVFLPFVLGLLISGKDCIDIILPNSEFRILGGPMTYLGLLTSLGFLFVVINLRGGSKGYLPKSGFRN
jgi:hypothetical protein